MWTRDRRPRKRPVLSWKVRTRGASAYRPNCLERRRRSTTSRAGWSRPRLRKTPRCCSRRPTWRRIPATALRLPRPRRDSDRDRETPSEPGGDQGAQDDAEIHDRRHVFENAFRQGGFLESAGPKGAGRGVPAQGGGGLGAPQRERPGDGPWMARDQKRYPIQDRKKPCAEEKRPRPAQEPAPVETGPSRPLILAPRPGARADPEQRKDA